MPSNPKDLIRLQHIFDAIEEIENYTSEVSFSDFEQNSMMLNASVRQLEIIGEALNKVIKSESSLTISNSRKIIDTRNRIIHGYDEVEDIIVWSIIIKHLPILKLEIKDILAKK